MDLTAYFKISMCVCAFCPMVICLAEFIFDFIRNDMGCFWQMSPLEKRRRHKSAIFCRSISEIATEGVVMGSGNSPLREEVRQTRDDMSLMYDTSRDDAAVQTGSSLSSGFDLESLGSMLMSKWTSQLVKI